jgi:hypothetical protein
MKVKDLLPLVMKAAQAHPDAEVLLMGGHDHSYNRVDEARITDVETDQKEKEFHEYYDRANLSPGGKRAKGFVIS